MRWRVVFYGLTMFAIGAFIGILYGQQVYVLEVEAHVQEWPCEIDEFDGI